MRTGKSVRKQHRILAFYYAPSTCRLRMWLGVCQLDVCGYLYALAHWEETSSQVIHVGTTGVVSLHSRLASDCSPLIPTITTTGGEYWKWLVLSFSSAYCFLVAVTQSIDSSRGTVLCYRTSSEANIHVPGIVAASHAAIVFVRSLFWPTSTHGW